MSFCTLQARVACARHEGLKLWIWSTQCCRACRGCVGVLGAGDETLTIKESIGGKEVTVMGNVNPRDEVEDADTNSTGKHVSRPDGKFVL